MSITRIDLALGWIQQLFVDYNKYIIVNQLDTPIVFKNFLVHFVLKSLKVFQKTEDSNKFQSGSHRLLKVSQILLDVNMGSE